MGASVCLFQRAYNSQGNVSGMLSEYVKVLSAFIYIKCLRDDCEWQED